MTVKKTYFAPNTQVLCHTGEIKNVEDVQVGDVLMGNDSTPRKVLNVYNINTSDTLYDIILTNGTNITVEENHVLSLISLIDESILNIPVYSYITSPLTFQSRFAWCKKTVSFPVSHTLLDPYNFGNCLNINNSDIRSIPDNYKINTMKNRLSLLAGIIDITGEYITKDKTYELYTLEFQIAMDVLFVCNTCGLIGICIKDTETVKNRILYRVKLSGNIKAIPCRIEVPESDINATRNDTHVFAFDIVKRNLHGFHAENGISCYGFTLDGNESCLLSDCSLV